jgi:hypothetical protein
MKLTGENRSTRGKTCPSATLSTKNPTWIDTGSNPGLRGGRPAANRLSHGMLLLCAECMSGTARHIEIQLTDIAKIRLVQLTMLSISTTL